VISWRSADSFVIGDVAYVCRPVGDLFPSTADRFCLVKSRWQVRWYEQFLRALKPETMIEIGTYDGASMALAWQLVEPRKVVGIDNRATPSAALDDFIKRRRLQERLRPFHGIDQADGEQLDAVLAAEFGSEPLDLVVDDASHLLEPSRATFNALFPRLRPEGIYVIEDWPMHRLPESDRPLTRLVIELILACSASPDWVANVEINRNYALVTRGAAEPVRGAHRRAAPFDVAACYGERGSAFLGSLG
jgi:predicted O-methyltransferase YrrM